MPKKKVDKYSVMCKIIEFAEKNEEITVYNMVKKLRGIGLDIEEETVRRILKELEKFGILKFKETSIGKTKKEKKVYTLTIPSDMARNIVKILFFSRNFLREITARIFSLVIVLVKEGNYSVVGFAGEHEFEKAVFNAFPLLMETYKPEFFVLFFQKNVQEKDARGFIAVIVSPFGTSTCKVTETKEEPVIDEAGNERKLDVLLRNLKFSN